MTALSALRRSRETAATRTYPMTRLAFGIVGRAWLWFLAASLVISLIPVFFGWNSYVISTGSMEPGIRAGDIVLSSPEYTEGDLVGRVITFNDPSIEGHVLTHRVVSVNEDGTFVTKGDANPTPDSTPVSRNSITGMGRLLVQFVGLPVVWVSTGNWLMLLLLVGSLVGSVVVVARDHEPQQRPHPHRSIPPISGLFVLLAVTVAIGGFSSSVANAGFNASTSNQTSVWQLANISYTDTVTDHGPYLYWKLDEGRNVSTAADSSGNGRTGTYSPTGSNGNFRRLDDGVLVNNDPNRAVRLHSNSACINTTSNSSIDAPQTFTIIAWFRAGSSYDDGGKLLGFERPRTGVEPPTDGAYDRHLYMDGEGRIWFGVYNNAHVTLNSTARMNDGEWHMAVGTQSSAGMRLYIDGVQVDSNSNNAAESQNGWWRAGCGNLSGWGDNWRGGNNPGTNDGNPRNRTFRADLDETAVFTSALSGDEIAELYDAR